MKVYLLQHEYELEGVDEVKLVGIYASSEAAEDARARAAALPGFSDHPDGFTIDAYEVGRDHWRSGFATIRWSDDTTAVGADEAA